MTTQWPAPACTGSSGCLRRHAAPATELPMSRPPSSECAQVAHARVLARDAGVVTARTNLVASSWLWVSNAFGCCCCCRCSWLLVLLIACYGVSQLVLLAVTVVGPLLRTPSPRVESGMVLIFGFLVQGGLKNQNQFEIQGLGSSIRAFLIAPPPAVVLLAARLWACHS